MAAAREFVAAGHGQSLRHQVHGDDPSAAILVKSNLFG